MDDSARPANRREFFLDGLRHLLRPLSDRWLDPPQGPPGWLRPPGALPEEQFLAACQRCGHCVEACPAHAIQFLEAGPAAAGTPVVRPDQAPCVICDDLSCMKVCPSGALSLVETLFDICMGLAEVRLEQCVRTHGEDCRLCIDTCPLGSAAIRLDARGAIEVLDPGCVGCGVCQHHCPTAPKAIVVMPPAIRRSIS